MKIKICFLLIFFVLSVSTVSAKGFIIYSYGDEVEKVLDLPHSDEFKIHDANNIEYNSKLGIKHQQFSLFWIPLINYGNEEYVLYVEKKGGNSDFLYYDLNDEEVKSLHDKFGIPLTPKLPFWDAWGGKLLFTIILALIFTFIILPKLKSIKKTEDTKSTGGNDSLVFALGKKNYIALAIGFAILVIGYALMAGGASTDPNVFNGDEIFNFRRITLAPIVLIIGFVVEIFAIMWRPRAKKN